MRNIRTASPTGYFHVIQRGTGKQTLFEEQGDYLHYLSKLKEYKTEHSVELAAYCLMQNHTHFLIKAEPEALTKLFHRLGTSYSHYFNAKYEHVGHVFQGRYISESITDEKYLRACIRYIHNNPVKAGYARRDEYQWSSYNEYVCGGEIADTASILEILGGVDSFVELCRSQGKDDFLDYNTMAVKSTTGLKIIRDELGNDCKSGLVVKSLARSERNRIIAKLKRAGLSRKQIELLTGVSKYIISRC